MPKRRPHPMPPPPPPASHYARVARFDILLDKPTRPRTASIVFSKREGMLPQVWLTYMQAHSLVRDLIFFLRQFENDREAPSDLAAAEILAVPPIPSLPADLSKAKTAVKPSRNASAPSAPINDLEAWRLNSMVKNARSHEDFMKFIGVSDRMEVADAHATNGKGRTRQTQKSSKKIVVQSAKNRQKHPRSQPRK